jgi:hypothetical protein
MKNLKAALLSLLFITVFSTTIFAHGGVDIVIKEGTRLTYTVKAGSLTYDFVATITSTEDGLAFDWMMSDPININGKIAIKPEALQNARTYHNFFQGGTDLTFTDKSSVFLSNLIVEDLFVKGNPTTQMNIGAGFKDYSPNAEKPSKMLHLDINGSHAHMYTKNIKSAQDNSEVNFIQAGDYYLIADMHSSFSITLKYVDYE